MHHQLTKLALLAVLALGLSSSWLTADELYRVAKGDNLGVIGKKFKVPYQDIMAANGLENTTIYVGQELVIPTGRPAVTAGSYTYPKPNNSRISAPSAPAPITQKPIPVPTYSPAPIDPAQTVRTPVKNGRGTEHQCNVHYRGSTYVVERGDSVRSISRKFGVAFWDLRHENDLWITKLSPGMVLKIPTRPATVGVAF